MLFVIVILALLVFAVYDFFRSTRFGRLPDDLIQDRIQSSPQYRDGQFQNQSPTPDLTDGATYYSLSKEYILNRTKRRIPAAKIPSISTNLRAITGDALVWMGHSSYYLQVAGKKFLVDPVLSGGASPVRFTTRSFIGTDIYSVNDIPDIDFLIITHDHWDHLDYRTVKALLPRCGRIITGLGTGAHLRRWGADSIRVFELDWNETLELGDAITLYSLPARHFSGRGLKRNQSLWLSFLLETPSGKVYIGGDSGYDEHFKTIGLIHGPIDLAILECGQYNRYWKHIHMMPEEVAQAAADLQARTLLPVHWSKFNLSLHAWDEPIQRVTAASERMSIPVIHPMIGQVVRWQEAQVYTKWWIGID